MSPENIGGATRREFLTLFGAASAWTLCQRTEEALAQNPFFAESRYEKGWLFSLKEMRDVYESEYRGEKILKNTIENIDGKWSGTIRGERYEVPQTFVDTTVGNIQKLFDRRFIRFLFRLDASHAHPFIPEERSVEYAKLSPAEETMMMARDPSLGILFHTAEHLAEDPSDPEVIGLLANRNFIGWYDGKDLSALPLPHYPDSKTTVVSTPGRALQSFLKFAAHKDGAFSVVVEGREVRFDISLDDSTYY